MRRASEAFVVILLFGVSAFANGIWDGARRLCMIRSIGPFRERVGTKVNVV